MFKIFVCFTYLLVVFDVVRCKPDYIFYHEVDGWLKLHTIANTWEEAFLRCHFEGAVLASPLDEQLAKALYTVMSESNIDRPIFLGTHAYAYKEFFSVEGVPLSDMPIKWGPRGNGADLEGCLTMHNDGRTYSMNISSCRKQLPYICYRKQQNETTLDPCGTFDEKYHLDERTGSCYKLHQDRQTWPRAHMICAAEGGHLVILNNEEEASIVKEMFPTRASPDHWEAILIGLGTWSQDRVWITIHGEGLEQVFHTWEPNQPDNRGLSQSCGALIRNGTLDDVDCFKKTMFVCEKDPTTSRFESAPPLRG